MTTKDLMVEAQRVRKSFGRLEVLKGIDMEVPCGTATCFIGPLNSDRSALLCCINHLEKVNAGRLHVDSSLIGYHEKSGSFYEISTTEVARQRRDIGMVFQDFNLFPHRTVLGNITEASVLVKDVSQEQAEKRAMELSETAGLAYKADVYLVQLSGGQQQRVTIAQALAMEPKLMLFDEPTSVFDPEFISEVLNVMRGLTDKGMTMAVVTHEMGFAHEVANQIVFIVDGVVTERDTSDEMLGNPKRKHTRNFLSSLLKQQLLK